MSQLKNKENRKNERWIYSPILKISHQRIWRGKRKDEINEKGKIEWGILRMILEEIFFIPIFLVETI